MLQMILLPIPYWEDPLLARKPNQNEVLLLGKTNTSPEHWAPTLGGTRTVRCRGRKEASMGKYWFSDNREYGLNNYLGAKAIYCLLTQQFSSGKALSRRTYLPWQRLKMPSTYAPRLSWYVVQDLLFVFCFCFLHSNIHAWLSTHIFAQVTNRFGKT